MAPPVPQSLAVERSIDTNSGRAFLANTGIKSDVCSYENATRIAAKPMKYYVNQLNSPQANPFETYSVVGNQRVYNIPNEYDRPLPSRLKPIYPTYVLPYNTTPNLGSTATDRMYVDTSTQLRFGSDLRPKNSQTSLTETDFNRWSPGVSESTVQNAGQFASGAAMQAPIRQDGYYDYTAQNNIIFGNSAVPAGAFGISSRNQLHNYVDLNCTT